MDPENTNIKEHKTLAVIASSTLEYSSTTKDVSLVDSQDNKTLIALEDFLNTVEIGGLEVPHLKYPQEKDPDLLIPSQKGISLLERIITKEFQPDFHISKEGIIAKSKLNQLEEASFPVREYDKTTLENIKTENRRVKMTQRTQNEEKLLNLNAQTLIQSLNNFEYIGNRVRLRYSNKNGEKSIYFFSIEQALQIVKSIGSNDLITVDQQLELLKSNREDITITNPQFKDNTIKFGSSGSIPVNLFENPKYKTIEANGNSFNVKLLTTSGDRKLNLVFSLEDFNRLLKETS